MNRSATRVALAVLALGVVWAAVAWPRISDVQTGHTPEYPDLRMHEYAASPDKVAQATKEVLSRLPGWTLVGAGQGAAGHAIQAVHETAFVLKEDISIQIRREGAHTRVILRSRSQVGRWDLGQNARNIRELLAALDAQVS